MDWDLVVRRCRALAEEAGTLGRQGMVPTPEWLGSAAAWLAQVAPSWEQLADDPPDERAYRLVHSSLHLEAWLICWPAGGRLQLHDHGGANGALRVVRGTLYERYVEPGEMARDREIGAGEGIAFPGDYLHDVVNRDGPPVTSVHLYGPASRPMGFYQLDPATGRPMPIEVSDQVGGRESDADTGVTGGVGHA